MIGMRHRLHFQKRSMVDDGFGNSTSGPFETQFTEPARLKPGLGSETIIASRLQGTQPYTATVRSSARTRQVGPEWRVVDARDGREFNIRSIVNPDELNRYLDLIIVEGVAT